MACLLQENRQILLLPIGTDENKILWTQVVCFDSVALLELLLNAKRVHEKYDTETAIFFTCLCLLNKY